MTLSPNCLSAEPTATPGDPFACFGVPTQSPGAAPATAPFASILTQADALGSGNATPAVGTAPAGAAAAIPFTAIAPGTIPGIFFPPLGELLPDRSAASDAAGGIAPGIPPTAGSQPPTSNGTATYPGVNYSPSSAVVAFAPVAVPAECVVGPQVSASAQTRVAGKKPAETQETMPEEAKDAPTKSPESSRDNSGQNALQLAYQFIAGQWMPQAIPTPVVTEQATTSARDAQDGSSISPAISWVASGQPAFEPVKPAPVQNGFATGPAVISAQAARLVSPTTPGSSQPGPKQRVGQPGLEPVRPASDQNRAATALVAIPAQVGQPSLSSTVGSVLPKGGVSAAAPVEQNVCSEDSAKKESPADASPTAPESQAGGASSAAFLAATPGTGMQTSLWRLSQGRPLRPQAQEKIAAPTMLAAAEPASGVNPSSGVKEKKPVVNDSKELTATAANIGTDTANQENAMPHSAVNKASAVVLPSLVDDGIRAGNGSSVAQVVGSIAAHAPKLVQEIRQIADRITSIDRNTVEVRFDFSDTDRLSVRVEYRDGAVQTTFRTDSSQLRAAISQEWQAQAAVTEQKAYRMAEPVFSQTASDRQNFSSAGGGDGSGRQHAFEQASQSGTPSFVSTGRNAGSAPSAAAPTARSSRPDSSLHLHALA